MRLLEVLGADLGARDVRRDRQHRHPAALRVEEAVDQMQVAGPAAARADRELSGQRGVGGRCEGGGLLVTHVLPRHFGSSPDRVGEAVEAVAGQAVDAADTAERERGDDVIGNGRHAATLCEFGVLRRSASKRAESLTWVRSAGRRPVAGTGR